MSKTDDLTTEKRVFIESGRAIGSSNTSPPPSPGVFIGRRPPSGIFFAPPPSSAKHFSHFPRRTRPVSYVFSGRDITKLPASSACIFLFRDVPGTSKSGSLRHAPGPTWMLIPQQFATAPISALLPLCSFPLACHIVLQECILGRT